MTLELLLSRISVTWTQASSYRGSQSAPVTVMPLAGDLFPMYFEAILSEAYR